MAPRLPLVSLIGLAHSNCSPRKHGRHGTISAPLFSVAAVVALLAGGCSAVTRSEGRQRASPRAAADLPSTFWNSATVYFLLTDRFHNGDPANDRALGRAKNGAVLRSFEGGDLAGVLQKIEEGYFDSLGVNAIWMTPFVEQIHGAVDEGTGKTYG